jgi:hypothetical protein
VRSPLVLGTALAVLTSAACSPHASLAVDTDSGDAEPVLLTDPDGGAVDWNGWAGEFVRDYCVQCHNPAAPCSGSQCHPTAGPLPDFRLHETLVSLAPEIRCGVAVQQDPAWNCGAITAKQFPVDMGGNPLPTDEQRELIVDWVDAGCP